MIEAIYLQKSDENYIGYRLTLACHNRRGRRGRRRRRRRRPNPRPRPRPTLTSTWSFVSIWNPGLTLNRIRLQLDRECFLTK